MQLLLFLTSLAHFLFEKVHKTLPGWTVLNFIECCFYFTSVHSLNNIDILIFKLRKSRKSELENSLNRSFVQGVHHQKR